MHSCLYSSINSSCLQVFIQNRGCATAGEALGEDEDEAGKDPDVEMVDRRDFIQLCEAMLDKAQCQLDQLQEAMQRG